MTTKEAAAHLGISRGNISRQDYSVSADSGALYL